MDNVPTKNQVIGMIQSQREELQRRGISRVILFGSVVRDEAQEGSDVDLLVDFDHPVGLIELGGTQVFFEELLGRAVDLGTPSMLREEIEAEVMREAVRAA